MLGCFFFVLAGGASPSARSMAADTMSWICGMSGSAGLITGGTSDSVETFWPRAFSASDMKRSTSEAGRLVEIISAEALAMSSKLVSACCGLICCSIAFITHFCRAIRE